jgi:ankyrin repeat and BTB/POZ domain-containing protein 1
MMDDEILIRQTTNADDLAVKPVDAETAPTDEPIYAPEFEGVVRTLDGEEVSDEFAQDALNYQILLGKIDALLDRLKLDA